MPEGTKHDPAPLTSSVHPPGADRDANASTGPEQSAANPPGTELDLTGRTLRDFQVLRRIGKGGMGQVYLAEQISLKRKVALKILRPDLAANPLEMRRFRAEAEVVARATHPNIVQVYAFEECNGLHYMALEYVEGRNLRDYLLRKGSPDVLRALSIMRQVAAALQRAAELGIVHRDIKPENILLTRKGEVKVADFGLSRSLATNPDALRLTQSGVTMGTPLYMSPEQVQGKPVDPRSDIYSFGVTCYHMLAGQPPFTGQHQFEVAMHHVNTPPAPLSSFRPDLPPGLCAVVHKMMAKDPAQRYQSAQELLRDLVQLRESLNNPGAALQTQTFSFDSVQALPAPAPPAAPPSVPTATATATLPRRRFPWLPAAGVILALVGGAGAAWWLRHTEAPLPAASATAPLQPELGLLEHPPSLRKREQILRESFELYANPGKDVTQARNGLEPAVELALLLLDQGRLKEAEELFQQLAQAPPEVRAYRFVGHLGLAIVAGLDNRPKDSLDGLAALFLKDNGTPLERGEMGIFLNQNWRLRQWVATALDYDAANDPNNPRLQELEFLRRPTPRLGPR
jgi:eukaryotic-like serine/threonine-protein kinase